MVVKFLHSSIKHRRTTGAIAPTGKQVTDEIIKNINSSSPQCIVEIGPGTGVFTKRILEKMHPSSKLICIEINPSFSDILEKRFPEVQIHTDSASNIRVHLESAGFELCDIVISGLPWAGFSKELQGEILDEVFLSLKTDGTFHTFAYTGPHKSKKGKNLSQLLETKFEAVEKSRTMFRNLPPAFVYHCTK